MTRRLKSFLAALTVAWTWPAVPAYAGEIWLRIQFTGGDAAEPPFEQANVVGDRTAYRGIRRHPLKIDLDRCFHFH